MVSSTKERVRLKRPLPSEIEIKAKTNEQPLGSRPLVVVLLLRKETTSGRSASRDL